MNQYLTENNLNSTLSVEKEYAFISYIDDLVNYLCFHYYRKNFANVEITNKKKI